MARHPLRIEDPSWKLTGVMLVISVGVLCTGRRVRAWVFCRVGGWNFTIRQRTRADFHKLTHAVRALHAL